MSSNASMDRSPSAVAVVAVAVASVAVLDPGGWFPFSIAKWPAVVTLTLVAGAIELWVRRDRGLLQGPAVRAASMLWAALLVVVALSAVFGLDDRIAWFGTSVRHLGAIAWAIFALLFAIGLRLGAQCIVVRDVLRGLLIAGGLLGAYTAWEVFVDAPVEYVTNSSRAGGPYGSAAYLGAACCLFLPIAIGLASDFEEPPRRRIGAGAVSALLTIATLGSGTRGALVALLATCVIIGVVRGRSMVQRGRVLAAGGVVAVGLALVVAATDVFERTAPFGSRLDEWRLGLRALGDRPLLGFGPEGYRLVVERSLTASYVQKYGDAVLPDRAHNAVLDVALSSGVFAALAYAALCVLVLAAGVWLIRQDSALHIGLGAAAIAFVMQQQFLFPVAEIDAVFWIVAGLTVSVAGTSRAQQRADVEPTPARVDSPYGMVARRVGAVGVAVLAAVVAVGGVRSVAADRLADRTFGIDDVEQSIADAEHAVELDPHDLRYRVVLARSFEQRQTLAGIDLAIDAIDSAAELSPLDPTVLRERARLASLRASITGTSEDRRDAVTRWQALADLAPNCASCLRWLGLTHLEAGATDAGVESLRRAAALGDDRAATVLDQVRPD